jgi:hypothetical protein
MAAVGLLVAVTGRRRGSWVSWYFFSENGNGKGAVGRDGREVDGPSALFYLTRGAS